MEALSLFQMKGKVSLVTGAGSGLGRVFCEVLAEAGSDVVCADINEDWAKETAGIIAGYGVRTQVIKADVVKQEEVREMFSKAEKEFGKLDVLIIACPVILDTEYPRLMKDRLNKTEYFLSFRH